MPINDLYKVSFIHIPKNGGTTVEYLLGMHGEIDTIGILPYKNQVKNKFFFGNGSQEFSAEEIKKEIGLKKFHSYTSFCISRNPYSRLVSYVAWAKQYRPHATDTKLSKKVFNYEIKAIFKEFQNNGFINLYLKPQWHYVYDINKKLLVNQIFKFEEFNKVLAFVDELTNKKNDKIERRMPSNHYHYKYYFTPQTLEMVNNMYRLDFELFKYPIFWRF